MDSASNRVLITGLDSFTGRHLSAHLSNLGYQVFGTTLGKPDGERLLHCDISNAQQCEQVVASVLPDFVIHLAGISFVGHTQLEAFYQVNTIGTEYLLQALAKITPSIRKIILASSATVYGDQGLEVLDESLCPRPANHYGISKLAMEFVAANYFERLPIIVVRPFNYTGVGQPEHFLVPKIVSHFKQRKSTIELGNLDVAREFNDISLACDIYSKLLSSNAKSIVTNLCSGKAIPLLDIVTIMNEIAGYQIKVKVNPAFVRPNEIAKLVGSTTQLFSLIGNTESSDLRVTLQKMYDN